MAFHLNASVANGGKQFLRRALSNYLKFTAANPADAELRGGLIDLHEQIGSIREGVGDKSGALESYGAALTVLEAWRGMQPESRQVRRLMAAEYANMGRVHTSRASDTMETATDRRNALLEARASYQNSLEIWRTMRGQGQFHTVDAGNVDEVSKDIAKCNAALGE